MNLRSILLTTALGVSTATTTFANPIHDRIRDMASTQLAGWVLESSVIDAIRKQNEEHAELSQADIDSLDQTWRSQTAADTKPMIDRMLQTSVSNYLKDRQNETGGLVTEVFVMDNLGLNVAQSAETSDYWQGDEDKFQKSFGAGSGSIHIGEIELDDSSGFFQVQVSLAIDDPDTGKPIGAATFGIQME